VWDQRGVPHVVRSPRRAAPCTMAHLRCLCCGVLVVIRHGLISALRLHITTAYCSLQSLQAAHAHAASREHDAQQPHCFVRVLPDETLVTEVGLKLLSGCLLGILRSLA
jgi:hypothetical protein